MKNTSALFSIGIPIYLGILVQTPEFYLSFVFAQKCSFLANVLLRRINLHLLLHISDGHCHKWHHLERYGLDQGLPP